MNELYLAEAEDVEPERISTYIFQNENYTVSRVTIANTLTKWTESDPKIRKQVCLKTPFLCSIWCCNFPQRQSEIISWGKRRKKLPSSEAYKMRSWSMGLLLIIWVAIIFRCIDSHSHKKWHETLPLMDMLLNPVRFPFNQTGKWWLNTLLQKTLYSFFSRIHTPEIAIL